MWSCACVKLKQAFEFTVKVGESLITRKNSVTYLECEFDQYLSAESMDLKVLSIHQLANSLEEAQPYKDVGFL